MSEKHYLEQEFEDLLKDPATIQFLDRGALDGLWYWDLENPEHEWMSPGFWRALGFDPAGKKHLASEWQDLVYPEDRDAALANFQAHLADQEHPYDQFVRYRTADGGTVTVRCRGKAILKDGKPHRLLGAHTIVHDTHQHEITLQLSELLEFSNDAIIAWSLKEGVQRWNRGAEQLYGYKRTQMMGADPRVALNAAFPEEWSAVETALEEVGGWEGVVLWKRKDGEDVITSTRLQRLEQMSGDTLILQIDRDITEHQRGEERRRMLARELNHRVKNLFAVVQALVLMSSQGESDVDVLTRKIRERIAALAAAHTVSISETGLKPVPVNNVIDSVLAPYSGTGPRLQMNGPHVVISHEAITPLGLILHELATNALKHGAWSDTDGRVDLTWRVADAQTNDEKTVHITWRETCSDQLTTTGTDQTAGFGSRLIEQSAKQLDAKLERNFTPTGFEATLSFAGISTDAPN